MQRVGCHTIRDPDEGHEEEVPSMADSATIGVVRELSPFGVELSARLDRPIDAAGASALSDHFDRHHLLLFRDQGLSQDDQVRVLSIFGPVREDELQGLAGHVSSAREQGILGRTPILFHSDMASVPHPLTAIGLYAVDVDGETATLYADGVAAAASLPTHLRARVTGCHAAHYWPRKISEPMLPVAGEPDRGWPGSVHPVLMDHPRTGVPVLYVSEVHTHHIVDMPPDESRAVLRDLIRHLCRPSNVYTHTWRNGDLVIWDNVALMHARRRVAGPLRRTLRRVVCGRPYAHLMPPAVTSHRMDLS
jgi:alpha-ketoglutarate-dependent taurine dioxygenase